MHEINTYKRRWILHFVNMINIAAERQGYPDTQCKLQPCLFELQNYANLDF